MKEICTPAKDTRGYPWNCSVMSRDELKSTVEKYAQLYCADPASNGQDLAAETQSTVNKIIDSIYEELDYQLMESCEELDGYWVATGDVMQEELDSCCRRFMQTTLAAARVIPKHRMGAALKMIRWYSALAITVARKNR